MANTNIITGYTYTPVIVFAGVVWAQIVQLSGLKSWLSQCSYAISYYQWIKCQMNVNVLHSSYCYTQLNTSSHIIQLRLRR